ncbi:MAG: site-2 protease family protein [Candidatus Aenigmarchaeota archaeon]|nr:site-2 protease family protein [Candidatus Aenigmarchaeota archaeon]
MSNYSSLLILLALIAIVYLLDRKNFKKEGTLFYLRRTEKGLKFIERFSSKHKKFFGIFADLGILFSFGTLGAWYLFKTKKSTGIIWKTLMSFSFFYMVFGVLLKTIFSGVLSLFGASGFIVAYLFKSAMDIITAPASVAAVQLVLPVNIPNAPIFYVPIDLWLISIFVILVAHEFSHAFVAKAQGINVKALGYGFLAILPLGFAEPDEKQIKRSKSLVKTRIYGAGSFANFIVALITIPLLLGVVFAYSNSVDVTGVSYNGTIADMPADGLLPMDGTITMISGNETRDFYNLSVVLGSFAPGDKITVTVDDADYDLVLASNPDNSSLAFIGISNLEQETVNTIPGRMGEITVSVLLYLLTLFNFIFGLNLGIGLFNLLPIKPLDGGFMFDEIVKTTGISHLKNVARFVSISVLVLLLFNIFIPFFL